VRYRRMNRACPAWACLAFIAVVAASEQVKAEPDWAVTAKAFFAAHCLDCHATDTHRGGLDLERLATDLSDAEQLHRWVRVYDRVARGEMPPSDEPRPEPDAARQFLSPLCEALTRADLRRRTWVLK
jgi:mono/diheme cytochrome c family protein